jgi:hypothetical protein
MNNDVGKDEIYQVMSEETESPVDGPAVGMQGRSRPRLNFLSLTTEGLKVYL